MTRTGSRLDEIRDAIATASWFAAVGEAWTAADLSEAEGYADALQLGTLGIAAVHGWHDAARIIQDTGWSHAWWDAEERRRQDAMRTAERLLDRHAVLSMLSSVMAQSGDLVHGKAALAAARAGVADPALTRVAAGAAAMACHHFALAVIVGAPEDHPFRIKFRLFAAGRWPLCVIEQTLHLF